MHSLIPAYRALHQQGKFPGYSIAPYVERIASLVLESGAETLLDYGCGKGRQYTEKRWHEAWGFMPTLYDPAVPGFDRPPLRSKFHGVICTDVLEHVPEEELDDVICELVNYAWKFCFISVCCRPAKPNKSLPGGHNVHCTVRPREWWRERLGRGFMGPPPRLILAFTP